MIKIKVKKLSPDAKLPSYAHAGDAGLDVCSIEETILKPGERRTIKTGISCEMPKGYAFFVWDKSGLSSQHGIKIMAGLIDSGYRGEYQIVLLNTSKKSYKIRSGDKIAQLVLQRIEQAKMMEADKLKESSRGKGGFGSTGK